MQVAHMFRTTLIYAVSVLLALGILVVSLFAVTFRSVRANTTSAVLGKVVVASPTPVNYALPYPGILPDSPLWSLKALRDRVFLWLTFDPKAKAERRLLYGDKRLGAAKALIEGGKVELGISTAVKGEKYLSEAVGEYLKTKENFKNFNEVADKLNRAVAKHKEVIMSLQEKSPEVKELLREALKLNQSVVDLLK